MKFEEYKPRIIDKQLEEYLKFFSAILVEGIKWCGKTWTSRYNSNSEFLLSDPSNNFNYKKIALMNLDLVLNGKQPRLIDEWKELFMIWDAVRGYVDLKPGKGQFILTGSASVNKSKYIHFRTG